MFCRSGSCIDIVVVTVAVADQRVQAASVELGTLQAPSGAPILVRVVEHLRHAGEKRRRVPVRDRALRREGDRVAQR